MLNINKIHLRDVTLSTCFVHRRSFIHAFKHPPHMKINPTTSRVLEMSPKLLDLRCLLEGQWTLFQNSAFETLYLCENPVMTPAIPKSVENEPNYNYDMSKPNHFYHQLTNSRVEHDANRLNSVLASSDNQENTKEQLGIRKQCWYWNIYH